MWDTAGYQRKIRQLSDRELERIYADSMGIVRPWAIDTEKSRMVLAEIKARVAANRGENI